MVVLDDEFVGIIEVGLSFVGSIMFVKIELGIVEWYALAVLIMLEGF